LGQLEKSPYEPQSLIPDGRWGDDLCRSEELPSEVSPIEVLLLRILLPVKRSGSQENLPVFAQFARQQSRHSPPAKVRITTSETANC